MPELPEVEVARRAIEPELLGHTIRGAECRTPALRWPLDPGLGRLLRGREIFAVGRRGKYLLVGCRRAGRKSGQGSSGWLIIHLGMSGSLRLVGTGEPRSVPAERHDHFDLALDDKLLRLRDPRRFGAVLWHPHDDASLHPLLAGLGPEPFDATLDAAWLHQALATRRGPIKPALMDSRLIVGIGNIYASESLFRAGISPLRAAPRISRQSCGRLLDSVREVLSEAIAAGGSSLRDYVHADGGAGCFQTRTAVYERQGLPCSACGTPIRSIRQAGRSSFFCPHCQR